MSSAKTNSPPNEGQPSRAVRFGAWTWVWAVLLTLLIAPPFLNWPHIAIQFSNLFIGFGAELPAVTEAVLRHTLKIDQLLRIAFTVQVTLLLALMISRSPLLRRVFFSYALASVGVVILLWAALYVPTFQMGQAL
jgi:hypothetical protein